MTLSVIGAGFGRTGTESLKRALEILGHGPCYHMYEVLPHPERVALWRGIAQGDQPDWDDVFSGYRATVDWPAAFYWRALSAHFTAAKIILSVRDAKSWYKSMDSTILEILRNSEDAESIGAKLIAQQVFQGRLHDREHIIAVYERNIADVQAAFGPDRLLTYELGSGWEPLCRFLDCPVPDEPYPSGNSSEEFHGKVAATTDKPSG
ncbi:sulfotransferase family protein [Ruegeria sp. 2012CJ41-6]|uniref:Sulfotransferase family protein n=1 Tax=Ruegeria spongiae TaxID=2942209 RepID=A0ABT0PX80_9RHOB|nr:sulfotransferase family protein [Ruegeria spongiae]MCL6282220.1 sulfotransferase family protein [Ruegeria spongiae]